MTVGVKSIATGNFEHMLNLLIKPASSLCNMRCRYCFYHDESLHRDVAFRGIMQQETADALIEKAFAQENRSVLFAFQGGEPTLAGLAFFESFVRKVRDANRNGVCVSYSLQTNGLSMDERWAKFLHDHHFLVGLSFDGSRAHDLLRPDASGKDTRSRVIRAARIMEKYGVDFNILTVVTPTVARNIGQIYHEMKRRGFRYLQFIPCLDPLGCDGSSEYTLSNDDYLYFLKTLFSLWYKDFMAGEYYSIRYFDNLYFLYEGQGAEQCGMQGHCNIQFVVEGDGDVYPCDFYCLDEYRLGNIREQDFYALSHSDAARRFLGESAGFDPDCRTCPCFRLCRSGCRRYKRNGEYLYCKAFREFYPVLEKSLPKIRKKLREYSL